MGVDELVAKAEYFRQVAESTRHGVAFSRTDCALLSVSYELAALRELLAPAFADRAPSHASQTTTPSGE